MAGIIILVVMFFPLMLIHPQGEPNYNLYLFLGIVHLLFCIVVILCGVWVSRHISSSVTLGHRILNRLVALCIVVCFSSFVGSMLYLLILRSVWYVCLLLSTLLIVFSYVV
jgi:hypothetical protein